MKWLILLLGIFSNASASILVKFAMSNNTPVILSKPMTIIGNTHLILGVFLYGIAFVLYSLALTVFPLNVAHPTLTSGSIALVATASIFIFNENISLLNWVGIFLIILGVIALTVK